VTTSCSLILPANQEQKNAAGKHIEIEVAGAAGVLVNQIVGPVVQQH
jgi:hypothetical protein